VASSEGKETGRLWAVVLDIDVSEELSVPRLWNLSVGAEPSRPLGDDRPSIIDDERGGSSARDTGSLVAPWRLGALAEKLVGASSGAAAEVAG
jgi:hypothetical protein